jgi:hypothetical protein
MTLSDTVTIRHTGKWDESRHCLNFLRPLVEGVCRRLAAPPAGKTSPPTADRGRSSPRQG